MNHQEQVQTIVTNIGENIMKIKDLCETTAGSIAAVSAPVGDRKSVV